MSPKSFVCLLYRSELYTRFSQTAEGEFKLLLVRVLEPLWRLRDLPCRVSPVTVVVLARIIPVQVCELLVRKARVERNNAT
eukprot:1060942-Rhodomonas_salina.1